MWIASQMPTASSSAGSRFSVIENGISSSTMAPMLATIEATTTTTGSSAPEMRRNSSPRIPRMSAMLSGNVVAMSFWRIVLRAWSMAAPPVTKISRSGRRCGAMISSSARTSWLDSSGVR